MTVRHPWKSELNYRAADALLFDLKDGDWRDQQVRSAFTEFAEDARFIFRREYECEIAEQRSRAAEHERPLAERIEKFRTQHNKLGYELIAALITDYREDNTAPLSGKVRGRPPKKRTTEDDKGGPKFNPSQLWHVRRGTAGPEACKTVDGFLRHCERHPEWLKQKLDDRGGWSVSLDKVARTYVQHSKSINTFFNTFLKASPNKLSNRSSLSKGS